MKEAIQPALELIQGQMKPLEEQLALKKKLINALLESVGEPPMYADVSSPSSAATLPIRGDQYFGRPMATVVREILERRKAQGSGAMPLNDLYDTMKAGGFEFSTKEEANAKTAVATTLGKNVAFIKVPNTGHWGLAEWYPGAKRNKGDDADKSEKAGEAKTAEVKPTAASAPAPASEEDVSDIL
jgi:hypothetical protein